MKETAGIGPAAEASLVSPHDAARRCDVPPSTIHKWIAQGRISAVPASEERRQRYPRAVLVSAEEVDAEKRRRERSVSARQAGRRLGVAETVVVYYCRRGYLPYRRRGKLYEIDIEELERFAELRNSLYREGLGALFDRRARPRPAERECALAGCDVRFRPTAAQVEDGGGRFCCHEHYVLDLQARARPRPAERECALAGCDVRFRPTAEQVEKRGCGRFCCREHSAENVRRRCWSGELDLPLMSATPRARRRWGSRRSPTTGRRQGWTAEDAANVVEIKRTHPDWGRRTLARATGLTERQVRSILDLVGQNLSGTAGD
jgi:DNA-binding transcriptional MerR regulator